MKGRKKRLWTQILEHNTETGDESCKNEVPENDMDGHTEQSRIIQHDCREISDAEHHQVSLQEGNDKIMCIQHCCDGTCHDRVDL